MTYDLGQPNPKQKEFLLSQTKYTAYGGARGGGKSWVLRKKMALMALNYPGIRLLIIRRSYPELMENHVQPMMSDMAELIVKGAVKYKQAENVMEFCNGSRIVFGYLMTDKDLLRYQGQEYDVIALDEATQFKETMFRTLTASLRGANDFPKRFYLTCNPGGVGHAWVKRLFVDRRYSETERAEEYRFIQAKVYDNTALLEKDPEYVRLLENLPPDQKAAWLEGRWDVFEGQFFPEFGAEHICQPFEIPAHWRRYFGMDYGLDMLAGYWAAADEKGELWIYREAYQSGLLMSEAAEKIRAMTMGEAVEGYFAPPDLWNRRQDTGRSVADAFAENGIYLMKVSNDRVTGWLEVKEWLKRGAEGKPRLHIFDSCRHLAESFPMLMHSQKDPNDVDTEPHEFTHGPDAVRYLLAGRPMAASAPAAPRDWDEPGGYEEQMMDFLAFGR